MLDNWNTWLIILIVSQKLSSSEKKEYEYFQI